MEYTYEDWKALKSKYALKNKDVAVIIGTSENNIKTQLSPSKKLPTWARAMIWVSKQHEETNGPEEVLELSSGPIVFNIPDPVVAMTKEGHEKIHGNENRNFPCGCYINDAGLFVRDKKCKSVPESHGNDC